MLKEVLPEGLRASAIATSVSAFLAEINFARAFRMELYHFESHTLKAELQIEVLTKACVIVTITFSHHLIEEVEVRDILDLKVFVSAHRRLNTLQDPKPDVSL
jgi:uridine kinase